MLVVSFKASVYERNRDIYTTLGLHTRLRTTDNIQEIKNWVDSFSSLSNLFLKSVNRNVSIYLLEMAPTNAELLKRNGSVIIDDRALMNAD